MCLNKVILDKKAFSKGIWVSFYCLFLLFVMVFSLSASPLSQRLSSLLKKYKKAKIGVYIGPLKEEVALFEKNSNLLLIPASNMKLLTTAAAITLLKPDYKFHTRLYLTGKRSFGVLKGDVWIVGGGDPNISGRFYPAPETLLLSWAKRLKTMGIHEIRGNLVMDDRLFDREWLHPDWDPRDRIYWYSAEVSALSLNDNCIDLDILGSRRGVQVNLSPQTNYITLVNRLSLGRHSLYRSRKKNQIFLTGSFPRRGRRQISVTIHNPPLYFGTVFSECLKKADIQWKGKIRLAQKDEKRPPSILVVDHTDSLRTVLSVINKRSQNLHAEMVFKLLGKKLGGEGSFEGGRKAVQFFLKKAKISLPHVIRDGSGLSRKNRLSPKLLIALLRWMAQTPQGAPFRHTLAISGRDGTLRKRLNKPHTFGRIFAKTGTLKRVSALSGYAYHGKEKKWYVFSILSNGIPSSQAKRLEDQILDIWLGERQ